MAITHTYVSTVPDDGSSRVGSNEWNADHTIADNTIAKAKLDATAQTFLVPAGGIIIWSGASDAIPSGWVLCNGSNGTPDLRDKFVVGAGSTYAVAATGGSATHTHAEHGRHTHTITGNTGAEDAHTHDVSGATSAGNSGTHFNTDGSGSNGQALGHTHNVSLTSAAGSSHLHSMTSGTAALNMASSNATTHDTASSLPPYYALCYIMKSA